LSDPITCLTTDSLQEMVWSGLEAACFLASDVHSQFPQLEVGNVCFDTQWTEVRPTLMSGRGSLYHLKFHNSLVQNPAKVILSYEPLVWWDKATFTACVYAGTRTHAHTHTHTHSQCPS